MGPPHWPGRARPWLNLLLLGSLWSWGGAGNLAQLGSLLVPSAWGLQAAVLSQLLRCSESKARRRVGPGWGLAAGRARGLWGEQSSQLSVLQQLRGWGLPGLYGRVGTTGASCGTQGTAWYQGHL